MSCSKLRELYGKKIAPFHLPIKEDGKFVGAVNVVKMEGRRFTSSGKWEKRDIPSDIQDELDTCREALLEAVAETSEELMDKYFGGEEFTLDEIIDALRINVNEGSVVPGSVRFRSVRLCNGEPDYNLRGVSPVADA